MSRKKQPVVVDDVDQRIGQLSTGALITALGLLAKADRALVDRVLDEVDLMDCGPSREPGSGDR